MSGPFDVRGANDEQILTVVAQVIGILPGGLALERPEAGEGFDCMGIMGGLSDNTVGIYMSIPPGEEVAFADGSQAEPGDRVYLIQELPGDAIVDAGETVIFAPIFAK